MFTNDHNLDVGTRFACNSVAFQAKLIYERNHTDIKVGEQAVRKGVHPCTANHQVPSFERVPLHTVHFINKQDQCTRSYHYARMPGKHAPACSHGSGWGSAERKGRKGWAKHALLSVVWYVLQAVCFCVCSTCACKKGDESLLQCLNVGNCRATVSILDRTYTVGYNEALERRCAGHLYHTWQVLTSGWWVIHWLFATRDWVLFCSPSSLAHHATSINSKRGAGCTVGCTSTAAGWMRGRYASDLCCVFSGWTLQPIPPHTRTHTTPLTDPSNYSPAFTRPAWPWLIHLSFCAAHGGVCGFSLWFGGNVFYRSV